MDKATVAAFVAIVGNAAAFVAMIEGNMTLAASIQADTMRATAAVASWKTGEAPTEEVIQVINLVNASIGIIPQVAPYLFLVQIAISIIEAVILQLAPPVPTVLALPMKGSEKAA